MSARLHAILKQKCPVCLQGDAYRSGITMHELCPVCGLRFEREQGYFLVAMYVAYAMAVPILALLTLCLWLIMHRDVAESRGRRVLLRLKQEIPRQMFECALQAAIGSRVRVMYTLNEVTPSADQNCT